MSRLLTPCAALLIMACAPAAEDHVNYSELRERWNATTSPYLDIRRTILGVNPGAAIANEGIEMTLRGYTLPRMYDDDTRIILGTEDRQDSIALQVRQMRVLGMVGWEIKAGWSVAKATDEGGDPTDPFVGLSWNLANERRYGVTLYTGLGIPVSDDSNWIENHGGWSYRGELRGSASLDRFAFSGNLGITYTPDGENSDAKGITVPTTPPSVETEWDTTFTSVDLHLLATYRFTRWLRVGVMQEFISYEWDGEATYTTMSSELYTAPTSGVIEVSIPYGWHLSISAGTDVFSTDAADGFRGELAITKTLY